MDTIQEIMAGAVIGAAAGAGVGLLVVLVLLLLPAKRCPECQTPLPKIRAPQSFRRWLWGGWTCRNCGCAIDRKGRKIAIPSDGPLQHPYD
jgi:hypothetical protein